MDREKMVVDPVHNAASDPAFNPSGNISIWSHHDMTASRPKWLVYSCILTKHSPRWSMTNTPQQLYKYIFSYPSPYKEIRTKSGRAWPRPKIPYRAMQESGQCYQKFAHSCISLQKYLGRAKQCKILATCRFVPELQDSSVSPPRRCDWRRDKRRYFNNAIEWNWRSTKISYSTRCCCGRTQRKKLQLSLLNNLMTPSPPTPPASQPTPNRCLGCERGLYSGSWSHDRDSLFVVINIS